MAISPLDLYEKAYQLQYEKNDLSNAIEIYKRLIQEFPDSNECGYAAIQLEKMQAAGVLDDIARAQKPSNTLTIIALTLAGISLIVLGALVFIYLAKSARDTEVTSTMTRALGLMYAGKDDDALKLINELKKQYPANSTLQSLMDNIQSRQLRPQPVEKPAVPAAEAQPESAAGENESEGPRATPATAQEAPPLPKAKEPLVLSRQQKALSRQLLAKPARKVTNAAAPAPKTGAEDSISFFP